MYPILLLSSGWGLLFLRIVFGVIMMVHGFPKLKHLKETGLNFSGMGFRPGSLWGMIAGLLESVGGIALVLGVATVPVAALFMIEFFTIVVWKLTKHGAFVSGWEFDLLLLAAASVLFFSGAGVISLGYFLPWGF